MVTSFVGNVGVRREILKFEEKFGLFVHKIHNKLWENCPAFLKIDFFPSPDHRHRHATS